MKQHKTPGRHRMDVPCGWGPGGCSAPEVDGCKPRAPKHRTGTEPCAPLLAGKSTLAQQLASRLNMPNVLQTDAIAEVSFCTLGQGLSLCQPQ